MTVRQLRHLLFKLEDQDATIVMSSDEEGNAMGDISDELSENVTKDAKREYALYPKNAWQQEDRYA